MTYRLHISRLGSMQAERPATSLSTTSPQPAISESLSLSSVPQLKREKQQHGVKQKVVTTARHPSCQSRRRRPARPPCWEETPTLNPSGLIAVFLRACRDSGPAEKRRIRLSAPEM